MVISSKDEEYFPRGGSEVSSQRTFKRKNFVFEKKSAVLEKKRKPGPRERKKLRAQDETPFEEEEELFVRFEPLTYQGLSERTLTLCSVREIQNKYVDLSLPGRLSARLYIEEVSFPYLNILNNKNDTEDQMEFSSLTSMFRIGQHLSCCVQSVTNNRHFSVRVSSDPRHVNAHISFDEVEEGHVIQMAIQSQEDHGYMMFTGVKNLIAFLRNDEAENFISKYKNGLPLVVGEVVWCRITKTKLSSTSNLVHVSLDLDVAKASLLENNISVSKLNPGVPVKIIIKERVSQNLIVEVNDTDIKGFVEPSHLTSPWSKPEDYKIGSVLTATVLYKFPYAKNLVFSFKSNVASVTKCEIEHGTFFQRAEFPDDGNKFTES